MHGESLKRPEKPNVVCADVDGSVLATDLLYESLLFALKQDISVLFFLPFWLLRGRAYLKQQLAERCGGLAVELLPLNPSVVSYLRAAAESGQRVMLASASDRGLLERLADQFDFVNGIIGSDGSTNRKGSAKAQAIREVVGDNSWEYIGDSNADFDVWREAAQVVCVASDGSFAKRVTNRYPKAIVLEKDACTFKVFLRALRVHQWMKNILVFAPIVLAHQIFNTRGWLISLGAAVSFSLCASGVYLLNDLLDLEADRRHPRKRKRPCASGVFPLSYALALAPILFISAFCVAVAVQPQFAVILGIYMILTSAYSYRLKALALVDIILLAILYTIRIVGGGVATGVHLSQWLLGLSMFVFFSLACVKRFSELLVLQQRKEPHTWGRGYAVSDMEQVASFGTASGYIAVVVLALYVSGKEVVELYANPTVIWMACPLLLYWISRIWLLARRGFVHDDPLVFALQDKVTYAVAAIGALIFIGAKW
jgi:4-hydroxybenzoate polyprenyltransferase/phosphoglycolate phosphatase-like HAD superfamily hydrolase